MNERLRELMVKADYAAPEIAKRAQLLAELIVKECLDISMEQKKWVEDMAPTTFSEQDKSWNQARIQQSQSIIDKIREHFGVEE